MAHQSLVENLLQRAGEEENKRSSRETKLSVTLFCLIRDQSLLTCYLMAYNIPMCMVQ